MATKRRPKGDGAMDERTPGVWRLRYRINGKKCTQTFRGNKTEARKKLHELVQAGRDGKRAEPHKLTVAQWIDLWIAAGAPGRRAKKRKAKIRERTIERYEELLRCHVVPTLGARRLQQLEPDEIGALYAKLDGKISARTAAHVHSVFDACLWSAKYQGKVAVNPMERVQLVPSPGESNHGMALTAEELRTLVDGFRGKVLFPIVAVAAFTGARRNEILALRWSDLDFAAKTLRIERALEETKNQATKKRQRGFKDPKTARGNRTISIDDDLVALLVSEREKLLRIMAGVSAGAAVDLGLVKLPADALMFPAPPAKDEDFSFSKPREPRATTRAFKRTARKLGFAKLRFHDLRGTHETLLLDDGVPLKTVADRCGHDPAVLLRSYAKRTKRGDDRANEVLARLAKGVFKNG